MWKYYVQLAWHNLSRTPALSFLMILAIATGIGACLTTLTLYSVVAGNPLAHKNNTLFAVQLDSWDPKEEFWGPTGVPLSLTFQDARAIYQANVADETLIMSRVGLTIRDPDGEALPRVEATRITSGNFFQIFDVPFVYGNAWDKAADLDGARQVVISETLNWHFFGGRNSVGEVLNVEGDLYTVVGVVEDDWSLAPSVYDLSMNAFKKPEKIYIPFLNFDRRSFPSWADHNGWKHEEIHSHEDFLASEQVWVQMWVLLQSQTKYAEFSQFLRNYIHDQKQIGRFERPLKFRLNTPEEWLSINGVVSNDTRVLVGLSGAFLLVCLVNAVVLLLAKFMRNMAETGLRRALGASRSAIFTQHLTEAAAIGLLGAVVGLAFSWVGLWGIRVLYGDFDEVAVFRLSTVTGAALLAIISCVVTGLLPAWQVTKAQVSRHLKSSI